jgi:hypothetical protein
LLPLELRQQGQKFVGEFLGNSGIRLLELFAQLKDLVSYLFQICVTLDHLNVSGCDAGSILFTLLDLTVFIVQLVFEEIVFSLQLRYFFLLFCQFVLADFYLFLYLGFLAETGVGSRHH